MRCWIAALLLLAAVAGPLRADTPNRVLILPFENATGHRDLDGLAAATADLLTVCYSDVRLAIDVVDRTAVSALLEEKGLKLQGLLTGGATGDALPLSLVQYVIRGVLRGGPEALTVSAYLHDLASTQLVFAAESAGTVDQFPHNLCDDLAKDLAAGLPGFSEVLAELPADEAPLQSQLMIAGIGHLYNGNYADAFPAFLKLIRENPSHGEAHYWLARSFHEAGLAELAEIQLKRFLANFPEDRNREHAVLLLRELETAPPP